MSPLSAVLIEDEAGQAARVRGILEEAGFEVATFSTATSARGGIRSVRQPVDLVVVDRRLPEEETSEPLDSTGDDLLPDLIEACPDSPFVVLTAHADVPHAQWATRNRGSLPLAREMYIDRVAHFEKIDYIGFEAYANSVSRQFLQLAEMVDLQGAAGSEDDVVILRRLLRKVAVAHGGSSLRARALDGGLSSASVYECEIADDAGIVVAFVVVKVRPASTSATSGGLHASLPATVVAGPGPLVHGLCGSLEAQTYQLAGHHAGSLMALLEQDDEAAARQISRIRLAYGETLRPRAVTRALADLVTPLVPWADFAERIRAMGLSVPAPQLRVSTTETPQHGDLHPANVLVVDDQPVLIDFDSETLSSAALDPLYLLLSMAFHRASPLRRLGWPEPRVVVGVASGAPPTGSPVDQSVSALNEWIGVACVGERERWAIVAAFAIRQMKYPDVAEDARLVACCRSLVERAVQELLAG